MRVRCRVRNCWHRVSSRRSSIAVDTRAAFCGDVDVLRFVFTVSVAVGGAATLIWRNNVGWPCPQIVRPGAFASLHAGATAHVWDAPHRGCVGAAPGRLAGVQLLVSPQKRRCRGVCHVCSCLCRQHRQPRRSVAAARDHPCACGPRATLVHLPSGTGGSNAC